MAFKGGMAYTDITRKSLQVRPAEAHEADLIGALTERVYRSGGWATDAYAPMLRDGHSRIRDAAVFVALLDGDMVGTVTLAMPGTAFAETARADESEVRMLAVEESARGHGIGNSLLGECETSSRAAGLAAVVLATEPDMHAAHRLYERRGYDREYERDSKEDDYTLLVYRLPLDGGAAGPLP